MTNILTVTKVLQDTLLKINEFLTITTSSATGAGWILQGLEKFTTRARMSFMPGKSRSLVLKKGCVVDKFRFTLAGDTISFITEHLVKGLGKVFDASLKDSNSIKNTIKDLEEWLRKTDKSGLPGRFREDNAAQRPSPSSRLERDAPYS